ncbi:hypothetical protein Z517_12550 [Fonsecaea pedrosoi CBS 271.37]|uniref:Zn(2)-C6 fungal-type domain-containing protein n=1 Tax=Fonsecaea pedrosoi CBS 271.37 TaxID=1442368 RepID=A0A0D2G5W1_9EURO|nr:uncharacterized protein Z517_12550 [Fonsecaea pedrosoi CBS 271.37]KIW74140.1 hypothetical protein Z517_12550 [Fonsecaea pedrosoi CBS 271.37]
MSPALQPNGRMATKKITRTKTGCLTCRRRRKKCDEGKPECQNCLRNSFVCEGYQQRKTWQPCDNMSNDAPAAIVNPIPAANDATTQSVDEWNDFTLPDPGDYREDLLFASPNLDLTTDLVPNFNSPSLTDVWPNHCAALVAEGQQESDTSPNSDDHQSEEDLVIESIRGTTSSANAESSVSSRAVPTKQVRRPESFILQSLPFLVNGIQTQAERKIFHHYYKVVSSVLLLETPSNPLVSTLIPLALSQDENNGLLDAIICLSASQYQYALSASGGQRNNAENSGIEKLKWKRHSRAVKQHIQMLSQLSKPSLASDSLQSNSQQLLILTMILYQFSLCEGSWSAGRRMHFNAARELIRQIYSDGRYHPPNHDSFNSFVLNWFYFHDICSSLTSRQDGACIDLHRRCLHGAGATSPATALAMRYQTVGLSQPDSMFLIGPSDGLLTILARIINLHREHAPAEYGEDQDLDIDVLMEGLAIEADLREWHYDYADTKSANIAECYRLAAFILLWFTIHPHSPLDTEKVQRAVQEGLKLLDPITDNDSAQTCSLLPLFVFGVSTNSKAERSFIEAKIERYGSWASIANIVEAGKFLMQWWRAADKMEPTRRRWWDWEAYLKANEIDIILV